MMSNLIEHKETEYSFIVPAAEQKFMDKISQIYKEMCGKTNSFPLLNETTLMELDTYNLSEVLYEVMLEAFYDSLIDTKLFPPFEDWTNPMIEKANESFNDNLFYNQLAFLNDVMIYMNKYQMAYQEFSTDGIYLETKFINLPISEVW